MGPWLAEADRDLGAVGMACFECRAGLPIDHGHLVTALQQMPGGADPDDGRDGKSRDDRGLAAVCLFQQAIEDQVYWGGQRVL